MKEHPCEKLGITFIHPHDSGFDVMKNELLEINFSDFLILLRDSPGFNQRAAPPKPDDDYKKMLEKIKNHGVFPMPEIEYTGRSGKLEIKSGHNLINAISGSDKVDSELTIPILVPANQLDELATDLKDIETQRQLNDLQEERKLEFSLPGMAVTVNQLGGGFSGRPGLQKTDRFKWRKGDSGFGPSPD